jgi:hypothetical protein
MRLRTEDRPRRRPAPNAHPDERATTDEVSVLRGEWFLGLAVAVAALAAARLVLRRPLLADRARPLRAADSALAAVSLALLVFHCSAMFAPDAVAALGFLDGPAAVVRDLSDPIGQAAYWIPAAALVLAVRQLWWPAPVALALTLTAVGWTMYLGSFTLTEHVVTIVAAGSVGALVATGLVTTPAGGGSGHEAATRR